MPTPEVMTNVRAERVRDIAALAQRSVRQRRGEFLVEGPQAVKEALKADAAFSRARRGASGAQKHDAEKHEVSQLENAEISESAAPWKSASELVTEVFVTPEYLAKDAELRELLGEMPYRLATEEVIQAMSTTVSAQGVLARAKINTVTLEQLVEKKPKLLAVLCQVRDPGNAGTILRAADAAGADAVLTTRGSVDLFNPKAVRSTVGSLFHVPLVTDVEIEDVISQLHEAGIAVLAADGYGNQNLDQLADQATLAKFEARSESGKAESDQVSWRSNSADALDPASCQDPAAQSRQADLRAPSAWLFGNEAHGLSEQELDAADFRVAVPLYGQAESLNVATAATVCLYASARAQH